MIATGLAIASAVGSVASGLMKSAEARRTNRIMQAENDRLDAENRAYYNREFYSNATQRADNQALITQARQIINAQNRAAQGANAVMGGTNATAAATKEANNAVLANAVSNVAANAQSYKTHVEDSYRQQNQNIRNKNIELANQRTVANQAAIDGAVQGLNTLATSYIMGEGNAETPTETASADYTPANMAKVPNQGSATGALGDANAKNIARLNNPVTGIKDAERIHAVSSDQTNGMTPLGYKNKSLAQILMGK